MAVVTAQPPLESGSKVIDKEGVESFTDSDVNSTSEFIARSNRKGMKVISNLGDDDFNEVFMKAQEAIREGIDPELIPEGSSGSYFVKDSEGKRIGVFKPKDEEPFAPLNPKWPKFFQRILCSCCFGRACLIPNSGYLSETGASLVDRRLGLNIVPKTRVVKIASPAFYYERKCCKQPPADMSKLRPKEGSFQLFVNGYESADRVMARWEYDSTLLNTEERKKFILLFQKMVALDYIIRNTDRHTQNWLIRHVPRKELELAAIDNGLAFPIKHPEAVSRLRPFPFRWQTLSFANQPWEESLRAQLLTKLTPNFVHELCMELKKLFRHDLAANKLLVSGQLQVLRGQMRNLRYALENNLRPRELTQLKPLLLKKRYRRNVPPPQADPSSWSTYFSERSGYNPNPTCCCKHSSQ